MYHPHGPGPMAMPGATMPIFYRAAINLSEEDIPQDVQDRIMAAEEFTCPICMEHPINPVIILSCGHTLCDGCADEHAGHGGLNGLSATCPECRGPMDHLTDYNNFCYMFCPERLDPGELEQLNADIAEEGEHVDGPHAHPPRFEQRANAGSGHRQQPEPLQAEPEHYGFDLFQHYAMPPRYFMHPGPMQDPCLPIPMRAMEVGFPPPYHRVYPNPGPRPHRRHDLAHGYGGMRGHGEMPGYDEVPRRDALCGDGGGHDAVPGDVGPGLRYPNSVYTGELPIPDIADYSIRPGALVRRRPRGGG
jgi:hypothetical protein